MDVAMGGVPDVRLVVEVVELDSAVGRGAVLPVRWSTQALTYAGPTATLVSFGSLPVTRCRPA